MSRSQSRRRRVLSVALAAVLVIGVIAGASAWLITTPDTVTITVIEHTLTYQASGPITDHQVEVFARTIHHGAVARRLQAVVASIPVSWPNAMYNCISQPDPYDSYTLQFFHLGTPVETAHSAATGCALWGEDGFMLRCCPVSTAWDVLRQETGAPLPPG